MSITNKFSGELSERAQHLFKVLVEHYISAGQPVGSRTLARHRGVDLSPATIRNVMADLEEMGLIRSPHTSAGRIPTVKGYRLFIDTLLTVKDISQQEVMHLTEGLNTDTDIENLLKKTSKILSDVTQMAGLITLPRIEHRSLRHVEFLPLSDDRVLTIIVINSNEVQNRIVKTERKYSAAELQQASNYLNQAFAGRDLEAVRELLINEMSLVQQEMTQTMQAALEMAQKTFTSPPEEFDQNQHEGDLVLTGQTNLMGLEELSNINKLKQLFEAFNTKRDILHLLDQTYHGQGIQIFIGDESGYEFLGDCSVVTSTYQVDGKILGALGVIGPTRMSYERVIPIVDLTAKILGTVLKSRH